MTRLLVWQNKGNVCLGILDGSEVHDGSTIILGGMFVPWVFMKPNREYIRLYSLLIVVYRKIEWYRIYREFVSQSRNYMRVKCISSHCTIRVFGYCTPFLVNAKQSLYSLKIWIVNPTVPCGVNLHTWHADMSSNTIRALKSFLLGFEPTIS